MADTVTRQAIDGGDLDVWGPFEQAQNHLAIGANTRSLYLDGADLKISAGMIGLYNGSQYYNISNVAARIISVVGLTASCWAKVELSVVGGVVVTEITSIAGETNPKILPAAFTGAYDGTKGGHYITATKRCTGLVWINAAGVVEGIVNTIGGINGYSGYSTSDDAYDMPYYFEYLDADYYNPMNNVNSCYPQTGAFISYPRGNDLTFFPVTTAAASFNATIPAAGSAYNNKRIRIHKVDAGAGIVTAIRSGADTFLGATAFPMAAAGDFIELWCDGIAWRVIDSLSTTANTAALAVSTAYALAHGLGIKPRNWEAFIICTSIDGTYAIGDTIKIMNGGEDAASHRLPMVFANITNITILTSANAINVIKTDVSGVAALTMNKWVAYARYKI
jgi:hypothetical protein